MLAEGRQRGYSVESEEITLGLSGVAAAVLDVSEHPVAGIAVTYPTEEGQAASVAELVRRTADLLTRRLAGR